MGEVQLAEARASYGFQTAMENIHSEMYSILIDTYIKDSVERDRLFHAIENFRASRGRRTGARSRQHGVFVRGTTGRLRCGRRFSSSFASIYWITGQCPG
jgi:ribonucleoside-diphosphate reductase beta chain